MDKKKANMEIDLKRLVMSIVKRLWLILLVGALVGVMAFGCATSFVDDEYAAEVRMYVNNTYGAGSVGFSSSQMSAAQSLAYTYMVILDSYDVLEEVAEVAVSEYGASKIYSVEELRTMITTAAIADTEVFRVVVTSQNRKDAVKIANAVKDVLPETVNAIVNGKENEADPEQDVNEAPPLVSVQQAEYKGKVAPNEKQYGMIGALVGVIATMIAVVARDMMDTSISSEEFLTETYEDIPLLAVIPDAENPKSGNSYKGYYETQKKRPPAQQKGGKR